MIFLKVLGDLVISAVFILLLYVAVIGALIVGEGRR